MSDTVKVQVYILKALNYALGREHGAEQFVNRVEYLKEYATKGGGRLAFSEAYGVAYASMMNGVRPGIMSVEDAYNNWQKSDGKTIEAT